MKSKNVVYEAHEDVGEHVAIKHFQTWVAERHPGWTVEDFNVTKRENYTAVQAHLVRDE